MIAEIYTEKNNTHVVRKFIIDGKCYKQIKTYSDTYDSEYEFYFCPLCNRVIGGGSINVKAGSVLTLSCPSCLTNI